MCVVTWGAQRMAPKSRMYGSQQQSSGLCGNKARRQAEEACLGTWHAGIVLAQ